MNILIGTICFLLCGLIGVVIMACCAVSGFVSDVENWTKDMGEQE